MKTLMISCMIALVYGCSTRSVDTQTTQLMIQGEQAETQANNSLANNSEAWNKFQEFGMHPEKYTLQDVHQYYLENLSMADGAMLKNDVHNFAFQVLVDVYDLVEYGDVGMVEYYVSEMQQVNFLIRSVILPYKKCLDFLSTHIGGSATKKMAIVRQEKDLEFIRNSSFRDAFRDEYISFHKSTLSVE